MYFSDKNLFIFKTYNIEINALYKAITAFYWHEDVFRLFKNPYCSIFHYLEVVNQCTLKSTISFEIKHDVFCLNVYVIFKQDY